MSESYPLVGPVLALVGWTLVMLVWTFVSIARGAKETKLAGKLPTSIRTRDVEGMMDERFSYPRRNYEHLVEQPTLFYALMLALAVMGDDSRIALALGWTYVATRIWHSLAQATGRHRGIPFGLSSFALLALFVHAVMAFA